MKKKTKIYIAGPMRGYKCFNFKAFFVMQDRLEKAGFEVINPAELDLEKMLKGWVYTEDQYSEILLRDLEIIQKDALCLVMLYGHSHSPGATAERFFGISIGTGIVMEFDIMSKIRSLPFESENDIIRDQIKCACEEAK